MMLLRTLRVLMLLLPVASAWGQSELIRVFVVPFESDSTIGKELRDRVTDEFEVLLSQTGKYETLERRRIASLLEAVQNEAALRGKPELVDEFKSQGAQAIAFGQILDDVDSGEIVFYVTLSRFDATIDWKGSAALSRGLVRDRNSRMGALRTLLESVGQPYSRANDQNATPAAAQRAVTGSVGLGANARPSRLTSLLNLGAVTMELLLIEDGGSTDEVRSREVRRLATELGLRAHAQETKAQMRAHYQNQLEDRSEALTFALGGNITVLPIAEARSMNAASEEDRDQFLSIIATARTQAEEYLNYLGLFTARQQFPEFKEPTFVESQAAALKFLGIIARDLDALAH